MKEKKTRHTVFLSILCLLGALLSGGYLLLGGISGILSRVLTKTTLLGASFVTGNTSVGIIGGADGPTAIFVSASPAFLWAEYLIAAAVLILSLVGLLLLKKRKPRKAESE